MGLRRRTHCPRARSSSTARSSTGWRCSLERRVGLVLAHHHRSLIVVLSANGSQGEGFIDEPRRLHRVPARPVIVIGGLLYLAGWSCSTEPGVRRHEPAPASRSRASQQAPPTARSRRSTTRSSTSRSSAGCSTTATWTILTAADAGIDRYRMLDDPIEFKKEMLDAKHASSTAGEEPTAVPGAPALGPMARSTTAAGPRRRRDAIDGVPSARRAAASAPRRDGCHGSGRGRPRTLGQPRRPARPRAPSRAEEYEAQEGGAARPPVSPAPRYHTRDPVRGTALDLNQYLPQLIAVGDHAARRVPGPRVQPRLRRRTGSATRRPAAWAA